LAIEDVTHYVDKFCAVFLDDAVCFFCDGPDKPGSTFLGVDSVAVINRSAAKYRMPYGWVDVYDAFHFVTLAECFVEVRS
jgi:hypothetical protein